MVSTTKTLHQDHDQPRDNRPVHIDIHRLIKVLNYYEHLNDFENQALEGIEYCHVNYEKDIKDSVRHQATADRIFSYLNIPLFPIETKMRRLSKDNLADKIENFDEICQALTGTPHEKHLAIALQV